MSLFIKWGLSALSFMLIANIVPGIHVASIWTALIVALLWGVIGVTLKPILTILTLPVTILTLGLFMFVINALFLILLSNVVKGFEIDGFGPAFIGALWLALLNWAIQFVTKKTALSK